MQSRRIGDAGGPKGLAQSRTRGIAAFAVFLAVSFGCPAGFAAESSKAGVEPKRVIMLQSFGLHFKPWTDFAEIFRSEMIRQSKVPIDFQDHLLLTARLADDKSDLPFVDYLHALYAEKPPDLIIALGAPAANFVQRYRPRIFPKTPMLFYAVEARRVEYNKLTENDTVAAAAHDFPLAFETILQVLPHTKVIMVINGASPNETYWQGVLERELAPLSGRGIELRWTNRLSFEDILKDAANLPPHSAIFWHLMSVDAAGVVHETNTALNRLSSTANAPIFSYLDAFFGNSIVGGSMHSIQEGGAVAAEAAIRILNGEKAGDVKVAPTRFKLPRFDWRQMQRFGISDRDLPPGSTVYFRPPTAWDQYRWQILFISAVIFTETLLILGLLYEHRRRRRAEAQSMKRMTELAHLNRVATAGELSASIAHEVKQPLAAIITQSGAALRWLAHATPKLNEAREALNAIISSGNRANEIVNDLRTMFRKESSGRKPLDINILLANVIELTRHEAQKHNILVHTTFFDEPKPQTLGERAQLEQVFLNLVMNAIEAMSSSKSDPRVLELKTSVNGGHEVLVTVADSGAGVDRENLEKIFDAFFTTKPNGMGMGLSICQTIIESHDGSLTAVPNKPHGMEFRVVLPVAA
jgi:signal transduction histidine kinase